MRKSIVLLLCMFVSNAFAFAFHYGNRSVELTTTKHTTPSLNIKTQSGDHYYGALFNVNDYTVPTNIVHIRDYDSTEYFLGPWCDAGQYPSPETNECIPCGLGHYCTGGHHRESCTYGIIACNTTNNTYDPPMPAGTDDLYNRALTMAEVTQYVPQTDIEQYDAVFASCDSPGNAPSHTSENDAGFSTVERSVLHGTYLVGHQYPVNSAVVSEITGESGYVSSAYLIVFDHDVLYRPIHNNPHCFNYFDTQHSPWYEADLQIPYLSFGINENVTNINNISQEFINKPCLLYLYKLK